MVRLPKNSYLNPLSTILSYNNLVRICLENSLGKGGGKGGICLRESIENILQKQENGGHQSSLLFLIASNFSFSHIVFKRLVLQTRKNQGLFGKGLKIVHWILFHK